MMPNGGVLDKKKVDVLESALGVANADADKCIEIRKCKISKIIETNGKMLKKSGKECGFSC